MIKSTVFKQWTILKKWWYGYGSDLCCVAGIREGGVGGINGVRSKTDQQLVHKPKKTSLETVRGHAVHGDGWSTAPAPRSSIHGWSLHGRWSLSSWTIRDHMQISRRVSHIITTFCCLSRLQFMISTFLHKFATYSFIFLPVFNVLYRSRGLRLPSHFHFLFCIFHNVLFIICVLIMCEKRCFYEFSWSVYISLWNVCKKKRYIVQSLVYTQGRM